MNVGLLRLGTMDPQEESRTATKAAAIDATQTLNVGLLLTYVSVYMQKRLNLPLF